MSIAAKTKQQQSISTSQLNNYRNNNNNDKNNKNNKPNNYLSLLTCVTTGSCYVYFIPVFAQFFVNLAVLYKFKFGDLPQMQEKAKKVKKDHTYIIESNFHKCLSGRRGVSVRIWLHCRKSERRTKPLMLSPKS